MIPYTTIPFLSAFFLVLVGVLIAQLWEHRSCDADRQFIRQLQRQNEELRQQADTQQPQRRDLQQTLDATQQQAQQGDNPFATGERQIELLQEERQKLEIELGELHHRLQETEERLRLEAVQRARLSDQQRALTQTQAESERQLRSQLGAAEQNYGRCLAQLQEAQQQLADERQQWQQIRTEAAAAEASLREIIHQLRGELDCRVEQLETLQEDTEQALAQAAAERKRRSYAEQSLDALRGTLEQLQLDNEALAAAQQEAWQREEKTKECRAL